MCETVGVVEGRIRRYRRQTGYEKGRKRDQEKNQGEALVRRISLLRLGSVPDFFCRLSRPAMHDLCQAEHIIDKGGPPEAGESTRYLPALANHRLNVSHERRANPGFNGTLAPSRWIPA
jgi:hypothetical protein